MINVKYTTLAEAAAIFNRDRSSLRRAALKLGITGIEVRAPSGQMVLAFTAADMKALRLRFPKEPK